jgi:glucose-6-phosphate isomerase
MVEMDAMDNTKPDVRNYTYPVINMGTHLKEMKHILSDFIQQDAVNRIWHKDHTVWKEDPTEISNRLGWLQITDAMAENIPALESFAGEVKQAGFHHVVLLGMGGSSLGPEVLRITFGSAPGYPALIVLDSTTPSQVEAVTKSIEPKHTLFLVSSKSGTTIETLSLYKYFRGLLDNDLGEDQAGFNFVAVTDNDTPLVKLARAKGFRKVFINPSDIGGRYSVLSYFGLVPAALIGLDIKALVHRANEMQESCAPCVDTYENPGIWLGALIGACVLHGRDKLTFIISPSVSSFGLWVEQLLAESTGKAGKGIIPIIGEPQIDPEHYGKDRVFVYLRMDGDDNTKTDRFVEKLEISGQPVIQLTVRDQLDLGAQFFRWEMATAVAGAVLGINPFDQPDVQATKEAATQILDDIQTKVSIPKFEPVRNMKKWLSRARRSDYMAIMLYMNQTAAIDNIINRFRQEVAEKFHIATTVGYGPRFLHSTGQLHKGGPDKGLFLQITADWRKDLPVPGETYSLGKLTSSEAQGDYLALKARGRRVFSTHLPFESAAAVGRLTQDLL